MALGIGERIKKRRIELGLTQIELAKKMGYTSKAAICKVETGDDNITTDRISRFAKALDVPESYLLNTEEEKHDSSDQEILRKAVLIIAYLKQLNDEGFNEATKRIEELTQLDKYRKE